MAADPHCPSHPIPPKNPRQPGTPSLVTTLFISRARSSLSGKPHKATARLQPPTKEPLQPLQARPHQLPSVRASCFLLVLSVYFLLARRRRGKRASAKSDARTFVALPQHPPPPPPPRYQGRRTWIALTTKLQQQRKRRGELMHMVASRPLLSVDRIVISFDEGVSNLCFGARVSTIQRPAPVFFFFPDEI